MSEQVEIQTVNRLINRILSEAFIVALVFMVATLPACTVKDKVKNIQPELDKKIDLNNYLWQVNNDYAISSLSMLGILGAVVGNRDVSKNGRLGIAAGSALGGPIIYKSHALFPCNYWKSSSRCNVANLFSDFNVQNYANIDNILVNALNKCGLNNTIYLILDCPGNGFVLVTDFEQVDRNGYRCKEKTSRHPDRKLLWEVVSGDKSVLDYLTSLFTNNPGYYRIFAFVVSNAQVIADTTKRQINSTIIEQWKDGGLPQLPEELAAVSFDRNTKIEALVYEFEITNSGKYFIADSSLSGYDSLERSGIVSAIKAYQFAQ